MTFFTSSNTLLRVLACSAVLLSALGNAHAQSDPPGRVARLSYISGNVTFAPAASDQWAYAETNRPLTTGDSVWADRGARAELHVGSTAVRLESTTSVNILDLSDNMLQLKLSQGSLNLRVRSLPGDQNIEIDTPNLAFIVQEPGEYRLSVAEDGSATTVTVRQGIGIAYGDNDSLTLHENEQMRFAGTNLAQAALGSAAPYDSFDVWARDRDRAEEASPSARYVSREIIGYEQLDSYGTWTNDPEYGAVWAPRVVAVGWSPYRTGHWTWVAPWGWTWIDDAPWGFAPYHYGRWAQIHSRWCWVPGPILRTRPVYAPALVAFVGGGSGVSVGLSITSGRSRGPGVAWFPLAPGESYRPGYHASPHYFNRINETVVINRTTINNNTQNVYINQHVANAVTAVPAAAFVRGQSVGPMARPLRPNEFGKAEIATAAPQFAPVKESILGGAKPAGMPSGAHFMQRPVVATVAPPVAPARQDALAQQFAQHPGSTIPGVGPAFVRQQNTGPSNAGSSVRNSGNFGAPEGRGRQPSPMPEQSAVRLVAGHSPDARRNDVNEKRPAPMPAQPTVLGNMPPNSSGNQPKTMPVPTYLDTERRPQNTPANTEAGTGRNPQFRENPAREVNGNVPRPSNTAAPFDTGNRQQVQTPGNDAGRNVPRSSLPSPAAPAAAAIPATNPQVSQPPRENSRQEYRPVLERNGRGNLPVEQPRDAQRDMRDVQRDAQRDAARNQGGNPAENSARFQHVQPQPAAPVRGEQPQPMPARPVARAQEIPQPQPPQQAQPQVQPQRREPAPEIRREVPRPAPVAQPAPMPAPAAPAPQPARQEKENREKVERFNQKKAE